MSNAKQQQPILTHKHIFGLKGDVKNNIWYTDENVVVYPCGHNSVIYNTETREQNFKQCKEHILGPIGEVNEYYVISILHVYTQYNRNELG